MFGMIKHFLIRHCEKASWPTWQSISHTFKTLLIGKCGEMDCCVASFLAMSLFLVVVSSNPAYATSYRQTPSSKIEVQLSYAPIVKKSAPAVVNIYTTKLVKQRAFSPFMGDPFFQYFFGGNLPQGLTKKRYENSLGSGVIVRSNGMIVTSHHVIDGADEITVVLGDRREFAAHVLLSDKRTDLAVLKIDTQGEVMPYLEMKDSDNVEVGDLVLAIGNPFGVGQSVTTGIVSAMARTTLDINDINYYIQTDAAINPGNSGGALVGMDGKLIGINAAIYTRDGGNMGLGFAVPANMVKTTLASAERGEKRIARPWTGVEGQAVTSDMAASLGLSYPMGILVKKVHKASPAHKKGLKTGDLIISVNGKVIDDPAAFAYRVATLPVGKDIVLGLLRAKKKYSLTFKLIAPPEVPKSQRQEIIGHNPFAGAVVANLSPALIGKHGLYGLGKGVVILNTGKAAARRVGLRKGDVVLRVNALRVKHVADLKKALKDKPARWRLILRRAGRKVQLVVGG